MNQYIVGVEDDQLEAPRIDHAHGEHSCAAVDDVYGNGHRPDSVCAMALAWIGAAPKAVMSGRLSAWRPRGIIVTHHRAIQGR